MNAERKGNFTVTGRGGIALAGFLSRKTRGKIMATPNAPTWLSDSDRKTVIAAIEKGQTQVTVDGQVLKIETTWQTGARCR
jgi:hypothetical protein